VAGVVLGQPNAFGVLRAHGQAAELTHAAGALPVAVVGAKSRLLSSRRPASTAQTSRRRGPAARSPAIRRALSRPAGLQPAARAPDPRTARGPHDGCGWAARLRDDPARP
jgi:hypothetical protein